MKKSSKIYILQILSFTVHFVYFLPYVILFFNDTLQNMKSIPDSPISVLEQAATQAHILIKHEYQVDINRMRNGHLYCRGMLTIGPIVIGRGGGVTKKKCKTDTYEKTLERLKTVDVSELMQSVPEEPIPENVNSLVHLLHKT